MFNIIRFIGLLFAGAVGSYRIMNNHLLHHEKPIYWLTSLTSYYMAFAFAISDGGTLGTSEFRHGLVRMGWLPVVACLIALQLYYRQFDLNK